MCTFFVAYSNSVACYYLLDMREKCTYGTLISVACQWMLYGLFIYLFCSSLSKFIKLNPQKDTQCIRLFQKLWDFCSLLSWKRHSCTTQGWYVLKLYLLLPRQTVIWMVTQVVLTFFSAVNFVHFFHVEHHSGLLWTVSPVTSDYNVYEPIYAGWGEKRLLWITE